MFIELSQYSNIGLLILRLTVAFIFIYHALPKINKTRVVAQGMNMPVIFVLLLGMVELLASLGLIFGFYIQFFALLLGVVISGAIWFKAVKWRIPFYARETTGWEFDLILLASNIVIFLS